MKPLILEEGTVKLASDLDRIENASDGLNSYFSVSRNYTSPHNGTALTTAVLTANVVHLMPFILERRKLITNMAFNVTTAAVGNARLGIYRDSGNLYPGLSLVRPATEINLNSTGTKSVGIGFGCPQGLYWLAITTSVNVTIRGFAVTGLNPILGYDNTLSTACGLGYQINRTYSALPTTFPAGATIKTAAPLPALFLTLED
ncbi:MAG: hypothetical protein SFU98_21610 [Leptospiraceae bacterium]|nr:hypothetical protein [Leptospiraceae bacterium]